MKYGFLMWLRTQRAVQSLTGREEMEQAGSRALIVSTPFTDDELTAVRPVGHQAASGAGSILCMRVCL